MAQHKVKLLCFRTNTNYLLDDDENTNPCVDRIIVISRNGARQDYVLTPRQMLELDELLNKFTIEAFNGELDESKLHS